MPPSVEEIKIQSRHLRGNLYEKVYGSRDCKASAAGGQLLKFFGDDREQRWRLLANKIPLDYRFMVRLPLAADQYLAIDSLADDVGSEAIRLTSRQAIQLHGVVKDDLAPLVPNLQQAAMASLAECGEVERNIMSCPVPDGGQIRDQTAALAKALAHHLKPATAAYVELFVDGKKVYDVRQEEPLYGSSYLPRKFKTAFAVWGDNCTDIYCHELGLVTYPPAEGGTERWAVLVGGGQGVARTHPLLAKPLASVDRDQLTAVAEAIITVQRDHGNRTDRRYARMKYLIEEWGLTRFRQEVERRTGFRLDPPLPLRWADPDDHLGWHSDGAGKGFLGLYVPQGRIADFASASLKTGLRRVVEQYRPQLRLTAQHNLLLVGLTGEDKEAILHIFERHGLGSPGQRTPLERSAMACVELPTFGLALTEAERVMPAVLEQIRRYWCALGLADTPRVVRMTGCPNNCVRAELAEVGFGGAGPDKYHIYLGGNRAGTRLAQKFLERVSSPSSGRRCAAS